MVAAILFPLAASPAAADPAEIAAVTVRVADLEATASAASQRAMAARNEQIKSADRLRVFSQGVVEAQKDLDEHRRAFEQMARQLYVNGGVDAAMLTFRTDQPQEFLRSLDRLEAAGAAQSVATDRARHTAESLAATQAAMEQEQKRQAQLTATLAAEQASAEKSLKEARVQLQSLQEDERKRVAAAVAAAREAARIQAEQIEAARIAAAQAAAAEAARQAQEAARQAAEAQRVAALDAASQAAAEAAEAASRASAAASAAAQQAGATVVATAASNPGTAGVPDGDLAASQTFAASYQSIAVRQCESSGNYSINTGNGYYGAWQFDYPSWHGNGGGRFAEYPHQATKAQQDYVAWYYYQRAGWRPWECAYKLGFIG
ncbi:MAG: transglycosylase family protein [Candidatus Nanopelagicales bacterium]